MNAVKNTLSLCVYPLTMALVPTVAWIAWSQGIQEILILSLCALSVVALLTALERWMPAHEQWSHDHGDTRTDLLHHLHALAIPGLHQWSIAALVLLLTPWLHDFTQSTIWPESWPFALQLALALVVMDAGTYWGHRLVHSVPWLWRLHEIHHSAPRMYWLNAQRFHPLDLWVLQGFALIPLLCAGAPAHVVLVLSALSMTHALFQHSNTRQRTRLLDPLFSTANVHRWHHAHSPQHVNFGGILSIWDALFGTRGAHTATPSTAQLARHASSAPNGFVAQLFHPWSERSSHTSRRSS